NGRRVLGVDLDPRATLTEELGAEDGEYSVNDLLFEEREADPDELPELSGLAAQALRPAGDAWGGNVQVLAAERALANRERDNTTWDLVHRLRRWMEVVAELVELVVVALPRRAAGMVFVAGLLAASHVLLRGTLKADGLLGLVDAL